MTYPVVGALLVAAVAVLTLPWSRRDPADFARTELGYAWRGPRGAVQAALGLLVDQGLLRARRGRAERRKGRPPRTTAPLVRAVFESLGPSADGVSSLLETPSVQDELAPVADRVIGARLRVGPARRVLGSLTAFVAPVTALVALAHGVGNVVVGVLTSVVAVLVASWLMALRGVTIRGARTLAAAPPDRRTHRPNGRGARLSQLSGGVGWLHAPACFGAPSYGADVGGGDDGGGGGSDGGGGSW